MTRVARLLCLCLLFAPLSVQAATARPTARNVILMIADGMGYNHSQAASFYAYGRSRAQAYWHFPVQLAVETSPVNGHYDPSTFWTHFNDQRHRDRITDSAAAATAMASGIKVQRKVIGLSPEQRRLPNAVELAEATGRSSGIVTSVPFTHATPAAMVAHVPKRSQRHQIAEQMLEHSGLDVLMGCGHPNYDHDGQLLSPPHNYRQVGGRLRWQRLLSGTLGGDADGDGVADPWTLIQSRRQFQRLMSGATPKRVLGIPMVQETLQQERSGWRRAAPYRQPLLTSVPTLREMVVGALNVLDNNDNGFFLMIEGGAIDWASHDTQKGRLIEEQVAFDQTVDSVIHWIEQNSSWQQTLLIIVADHETGLLTGPPGDSRWTEPINRGRGRLPTMRWNRHGHSNQLVPLFAKGVAADQLLTYALDRNDPVRGRYIDNTAIGRVIHRAMGAPPF